jgi:hypothetical protein
MAKLSSASFAPPYLPCSFFESSLNTLQPCWDRSVAYSSKILGWATSYAPNPEKEKACYQAAAKTGHNTEQCKTLWERTSPTRRFVRAEIRANSREVFLGSLPAFWKLRVLSYLVTKYFFFKIQAGFLKSSLEVQKVKNDLYC